MHNLKEIKVWKKAIKLATEIFLVVSDFPKEEKFGLSNQIKRAAVSVASNIAEGAGRNSNKEFARFLSIANGSCYELLTQITIASKLGLMDKSKSEEICKNIVEIQKMIYGFKKKLKKDV
ncbi:four helix bundle protein [Sphingobacterium sp. BN32]|uniref:four helix bundle protein n=1 Tax=Sphingobacterium sp. BN32 TaxID=3058432 RepID=UPI00265D27EB|nr:four helix bundle protein [Sphingobacterium sp. BN32]WKK58110.1 four helix bundle protein [Sphingobacterium sp. BN32]